MIEAAQLPSTEHLADDEYNVYALCYARNNAGRVGTQFMVPTDPHDAPMPMDFSIWIAENSSRRFIVDLGYEIGGAQRRGRTMVYNPADALARIGIDPAQVADIVLSHLHWDHAGNIDRFPNARVHVQDAEVAFVCGRCMGVDLLRMPFEADDIVNVVRKNFAGKLCFHDGGDRLFPGVTLHRFPGHAAGLQAVRVKTRRGPLLLASDGAHYYANVYNAAPFFYTMNLIETLDSFRRMRDLAPDPAFLIPGHDPKVRAVYPKTVINGVLLSILHETPSPPSPDFFNRVDNFSSNYPHEAE